MATAQYSAITKRPNVGLDYESIIRQKALQLPSLYAQRDADEQAKTELDLSKQKLEIDKQKLELDKQEGVGEQKYYNEMLDVQKAQVAEEEKSDTTNQALSGLSTAAGIYGAYNSGQQNKELISYLKGLGNPNTMKTDPKASEPAATFNYESTPAATPAANASQINYAGPQAVEYDPTAVADFDPGLSVTDTVNAAPASTSAIDPGLSVTDTMATEGLKTQASPSLVSSSDLADIGTEIGTGEAGEGVLASTNVGAGVGETATNATGTSLGQSISNIAGNVGTGIGKASDYLSGLRAGNTGWGNAGATLGIMAIDATKPFVKDYVQRKNAEAFGEKTGKIARTATDVSADIGKGALMGYRLGGGWGALIGAGAGLDKGAYENLSGNNVGSKEYGADLSTAIAAGLTASNVAALNKYVFDNDPKKIEKAQDIGNVLTGGLVAPAKMKDTVKRVEKKIKKKIKKYF